MVNCCSPLTLVIVEGINTFIQIRIKVSYKSLKMR